VIEHGRRSEDTTEGGGICDGREAYRALLGRFGATAVVGPEWQLAREQLDVVNPFPWALIAPLKMSVVSWADFELN
jgi:hypothetical protein